MFNPVQFASIFLLTIILAMPTVQAADPVPDPDRPPSLKTVPIPKPDNLHEFVKDEQQAIALGKALFWDMHVGSDGTTACASCHFNAGADSRDTNQISPGSDLAFDFGPNRKLTKSDYPFRQLDNPNDRSSDPVFDSNDVASSQGVFAADFMKSEPGESKDSTAWKADEDGFLFGNKNLRRVAGRNAPPVINAVFNHRNFSDGRAQNKFNGVNIWGDRDPDAKVYKASSPSHLELVQISMNNSSLASQAVGPPGNDREMSAKGRTFPHIGRKLLGARPLALQQVHPSDSVLGSDSRWPQKGLNTSSYADMVKAAFHQEWWNSSEKIRVANGAPPEVVSMSDSSEGDYSLMEHNFALFFGLAIQMYESTLVADDTPYDRFMNGDDKAISEAAVQGVDVFRSQTRGRCINCHEGAELTGASVTAVTKSPFRIRNEQAFDRGYNNISVRPATEDVGLGGTDPFGNPLAYIRLEGATIPTCANGQPCPVVADGSMKVPGLRNVELTAPYFHNGGTLSLSDVIDFYSRGGDFAKLEQLDGSEIAPLNILLNSGQEKAALVAFLTSLTDDRVRYQKAPFDHPQLFVANGHKLNPGEQGNAEDEFMEIEAVGREGGHILKQFME